MLPASLANAAVLLNCQDTAIATPSFADEVLKQILVERVALSLTVVNAPPRFAELLLRAAVRLRVDDRLQITSGDVESDRVSFA